MKKEPFAIQPNNAIVQEANEYSITPYCTRSIMQKLNESRKACSASCDVVIAVGDEQFFCHRAILMESIPYFNKMFKSNFKESGENVITLKNLDAKAFATILESVYIGELKFPLSESIADALNIITVCDYLGLADTLDKCLEFFRRYLTLDTIFDICVCIAEIGCDTEDLFKIVYNFILEYFPTIYRSERFYSIAYCILEEVLKDDFVNATEKEILLAINKWISYDERNRLKFLNQLIGAVRIPYLYSLSGIGDNRSNTTRTLLNRVRWLKAQMCNNPTKQEGSSDFNLGLIPPVDKRTYKSIYFFCNSENKNIDVIRYNGKSLESVPSMCEKTSSTIPRVVKLGSNFYSYSIDTVNVSYFRCFNNIDQCWLNLRNPPAPAGEYGEFNMVRLNNLQCVYLNYGSSDRIMCYNPALDVWFKVPEYLNNFRNNCLVADDDNNVIYTFGATNGKNSKSAMFDARIGKWSKIASIPRIRRSSAAACTENKIFVTGGNDGSKWYKTGFIYNVRSNSWSNLQPMPIMTQHLLLPFENHLWAVSKNCVITYSLSDRHWSPSTHIIDAGLEKPIRSATVD